MAIAIQQDAETAAEQVIPVDIRKLAAAATLCRKVRPGKRAGQSAWHGNVLVHGTAIYGGDPHETTVQVQVAEDYAHRAFAVPYDSITAAAKGRKGTAELRFGSITFPDGTTFGWKHDGSATAEMQTQRPVGGVGEDGWVVDYDGGVFRDAVAATVPSASTDASRPVLTGVYVDPNIGQWHATDSYRMIVATVPDNGGFDCFGGDGAIIPASALKVAAAVKGADYFQVGADDVDGRYVNRYVEIVAGVRVDRTAAEMLAVITACVIPGQYPDCGKLIPEGAEYVLALDDAATAAVIAFGRSAGMANRPLTVTFGGDSRAVILQHGSSTSSVALRDPINGEQQTVGLNAAFLADCLAAMPSGGVELHVISPLRPVTFRPCDPSQGAVEVTAVCMPVRTV